MEIRKVIFSFNSIKNAFMERLSLCFCNGFLDISWSGMEFSCQMGFWILYNWGTWGCSSLSMMVRLDFHRVSPASETSKLYKLYTQVVALPRNYATISTLFGMKIQVSPAWDILTSDTTSNTWANWAFTWDSCLACLNGEPQPVKYEMHSSSLWELKYNFAVPSRFEISSNGARLQRCEYCFVASSPTLIML